MAVYTNIDNPFKHFNTILWTGNGADGRALTGVGFQPDLVWIKDRDDTESHRLTDSVRGATKSLRSNQTNAEATETDGLQSFDSDGFTVGTQGSMNKSNGDKFVGWSWLTGGSASSNSDGSITSSVSANTTAGFSIVSYTGTGATATIGHGLGSAPKWVIVKQRDNTRNWVVMHQGIGFTKYLYLDSNQASNTGNFFNDTDPSSTVFNVVNDSGVNGSSGSYIAYCFAEKQGYSKFNSYKGNGNTDGTFIYTGFAPSFVMLKRTSAAGSFLMFDNKRDNLNPNSHRVYANATDAEDTGSGSQVDFLSNGFKCRSSDNSTNASGSTYIFMAFAENPFVTAGTKAAGTAK